MEYSSIFWWTTLWLVFWGIAGSIGTRRIYLKKDLDTSNAVLMGSLIGASLGPVGLVHSGSRLRRRTPG
jgi:CHASE2 domain-containing sensor protein